MKVVEGRRATIESILHHFIDDEGRPSGEVLSLTVKGVSRSGTPVVRYDLPTSIGRALAQSLARVILSAAGQGAANSPGQPSSEQPPAATGSGAKKAADDILLDLHRRISAYPEVAWKVSPMTSPRNGKVPEFGAASASAGAQERQLPARLDGVEPRHRDRFMERVAPGFAEFAQSPAFALDRRWVSEHQTASGWAKVEGTILLDRQRVALDVEVVDAEDELVLEDSFAVPLPPRDASRPLSPEALHIALEDLVNGALHEFRRSGVEGMREMLSSRGRERQPQETEGSAARGRSRSQQSAASESDSRILEGDLAEGTTTFFRALPSGAQILINAGENAAALIVRASSSEFSAAVAWPIRDAQGIDRPNSTAFHGLRRAADLLATGNLEQRRAVLTFLEKLTKDTTGRPPIRSGCSVESLLGAEMLDEMRSLYHIQVSNPAAERDDEVIELMNGIQSFKIHLKNPALRGSALTGFPVLRFGLFPDESLYVRASNPVGGQLKAFISAASCGKLGGFQEVVRSIAEELGESRTPSETRVRVYSVLEDIFKRDVISNALVSPYSRMGRMVPPPSRHLAQQAYDLGGKVARVWSAGGVQQPGDVKVEWIRDTDRCRVSVGEPGERGSFVELDMSHKGITKMEFFLAYGEQEDQVQQAHVELDLVAAKGEPSADFAQLSSLLSKLSELIDSRPASLHELERSALFRAITTL